ncbi:MAG: enoyl-CoA hydratase [Pseudomonadota bacterium]|nr:enoyl-CoA hydratase [Pseudomonadota bacterium]
MTIRKINTGTKQLICEVCDGVATITLNRPEVRNALGDIITPALRRQIQERADDPEVGALMITGAGVAFCAGGDVKGMGTNRSSIEMKPDQKIAQLKERQRTLTGALIGVRKPTLAALPGPAAGAGLAIALACDIRIASKSAFVSTGYARVGLSGDYGIAWLITRLVGTAKARELMFTAERVDANTCENLGLVNRVVPDENFRDEAFKLARTLAHGPSVALRRMKDNLDDALTQPFLTALDGEAERLIEVAQTEDHKEAVRAFIEKRSPKFRGQ